MPGNSVDWKISGLRELDAQLANLPIKTQAKVIRPALSAGARIIRDDARSRIHDAPHWDKNRTPKRSPGGALRDAIRFTTSVRLSSGTASARIFINKRRAWWGRLVHFGTLPHQIFAKKLAASQNRFVRKGIFGKARFQYRTAEKRAQALNVLGHLVSHVDHPGAAPNPFLERAADSKAQAAVSAMIHVVRQFFDSYGKNS